MERWDYKLGAPNGSQGKKTCYAAAKSLLYTPAFVWWAPHVPKKRTIIIADVTKRYHKRTHKFGIEVSKDWDDCVILDKDSDSTLWQDVMRK
jgi:hypothetical protein